jgi:hypothetical protein
MLQAPAGDYCSTRDAFVTANDDQQATQLSINDSTEP